MGVSGERFADAYADAFRQYLAGGSERSLETAYELGRIAVAERLSLMELAEAHHAALGALLTEGGANGVTVAAADFFRESLATFEIAARAFQGAQETLRLEQSHAATQHALAETAVALNERLDPSHILQVAADRACQVTGGRAAVAQIRLEGSGELLRVAAGEGGELAEGAVVNASLLGRDRRRDGWLVVRGVSAPEQSEPIVAQIAQMASSAIENAQRYQHERYVAETLQRSLLPAALPHLPGLDAAATYWPAADGVQVGGDFYDVFRTAAGEWAVVIGDVCGKGPDAASLTALARYTVRAASLHERSPGAVLRLLNAAMREQWTDGRFATVLCAYVRPTDGGADLVLASGGHPVPLVLRADGRVEALGDGGMLLGVFDDPAIPDSAGRLERGDLLLFYTDGAVEVRRDGGQVVFGGEELRQLLRDCGGAPAAEVLETIRAALDAASGGALRDDVALIALHVRG
jgi:serine phosphatase RsbU (regulator of sigma subunit)